MTWFLQYYRLATVSACLLLLVLGYLFLIAPRIESARAVEVLALQKEKEKQSSFEAKLKYLVSLQSQRAQFSQADINLALTALPTDPGVPEFLASLESLALESGATIEGISLAVLEPAKGSPAASTKDTKDKDKLPAGVRVLEGNISLAGASYGQVKTLLGNIETSLRLMDVAALLYSPAAKTYTIAVQTYYQP